MGHDFARHPADDGDEEAAEVFDGLGTDMVLTGFPILSVSKVEFRSGTATYGAWVDLPIIAWIAYERFIRLDRNTPVGFKNVRITYAYGYDDTPGPIVRATCRIVTNILQGAIQRSTSPIIRVDTFMIQLAKEEAFTQEIKTSLDGYRRIPHRVGTT